jgi:ketosteroid isomerase-like protein
MRTPSNADLVREVYELWAAGERDETFRHFAADAVFDWSRRQLDPMVATGADGFEAAVEALESPWASHRMEVEDTCEKGELVAALVRVTGRGAASGAAVDARVAHVWTIENGKVTRMEYFPDRTDAMALVGG